MNEQQKMVVAELAIQMAESHIDGTPKNWTVGQAQEWFDKLMVMLALPTEPGSKATASISGNGSGKGENVEL